MNNDSALVPKIEEVLQSLRPMIQSDGGDIQLVAFKEGVAYVQLKGACATCASAPMTLQFRVEDQIKQEVPQVRSVVSVASV
jgi:Fe-S cluster biogenesis protein NfuA